MLRFFRLNDPYRLIIIFLLLLIIRLPIMLWESDITVPELYYMLVGEKLNQGATLYEGVQVHVAPLSALAYGIIDFFFGRSQLAYQLIAWLLVAFQSLLFNRVLLNSKAYKENTYVPGLVYALLMSVCFDFMTLTPVLMGLTFMLLAMQNIFAHIEFRSKRDEKIMNIGLYLGIAYLFYLPYAIFGIAALLVFVLFTATIIRRYLLLVYGFLLPFAMASLYFFFYGRFSEFLYNYLGETFGYETHHYIGLGSLGVLFSIPLLFLLLSWVMLNRKSRLNNYQNRLIQTMFVWTLLSVGFIFFGNTMAPHVFQPFVIPGAFFITHYFLLVRRKLYAEIAFLFFFTSIVLFSLGTYFHFFVAHRYITYTGYKVDTARLYGWEGKSILILDDEISGYFHAKVATPFLDWQLSEPLFRNPDYYDNLSLLYNGFFNDLPEIIMDRHDVLPAVFQRIPSMGVMYEKKPGNVYYLKSGFLQP